MPGAPTSTFGYTFSLSPATLSLVNTRELSIAVNGAAPLIQTLSNWMIQSPESVFNLGDIVSVVLTDIDQVGNRSVPSDPLNFTVMDDVPPPKPSVTVLTKRQIT